MVFVIKIYKYWYNINLIDMLKCNILVSLKNKKILINFLLKFIINCNLERIVYLF